MDVGLLLQQIGVGIDIPLVVEVIGRDDNGCVVAVRRVPVLRVSMVDDAKTCARLIVDEDQLDTATVYPDHEALRYAERTTT